MFLVKSNKFYLYSKNINFLNHLNKLHSGVKNRQVEEIKIPVPWGFLAGKWWGPQNKRPILCLHGRLDSCSTFDSLISKLPEEFAYLAIDLQGHGHSSRLPKGMYYHPFDYEFMIRRIQKYFNWPKVSLMGHSLGAVISFVYSTLFPNEVDMVICLDAIKPISLEFGDAFFNSKHIDLFLKYDELNNSNDSRPSYTYEEIIEKILTNNENSIWPENCKYLLDRTTKKVEGTTPNKFYFTTDYRLKIWPPIAMQHMEILYFAKASKSPTLLIKARQSSYFEDKKNFYDFVDVLKSNNNLCEFVHVDGTHHVHVNEPEKIAALIIKFFRKTNFTQ